MFFSLCQKVIDGWGKNIGKALKNFIVKCPRGQRKQTWILQWNETRKKLVRNSWETLSAQNLIILRNLNYWLKFSVCYEKITSRFTSWSQFTKITKYIVKYLSNMRIISFTSQILPDFPLVFSQIWTSETCCWMCDRQQSFLPPDFIEESSDRLTARDNK